MTTSDVDAARLRQGLYRFIGGALSPPGVEWLEAAPAAASFLRAMGTDEYAFGRQFQAVVRELDAGVDPAGAEREYVRLFATAADRTLSPPSESFYVGDGMGSGSAVVGQLVREYLSMGIAMTGMAEEPDHISTECEVMSLLCAQEADAWEAERLDIVGARVAAQARFLRSHLLVWFPLFRAGVMQAGPGGFYHAIVDAAHAFFVHDLDFTRLMIGGLAE